MEKYLFTIQNVETGKLNALVNNIMKQLGIDDPHEAIRLVNSGKVQLSIANSKWIEEDVAIRFSVTSDGKTGEQWIVRLESQGFLVDYYAKQALLSEFFKPTIGVVYEIVVLKKKLFRDAEGFMEKICEEAQNRNLLRPNAELACLIREKFSDNELADMGLYWIAVMHEPIKDSLGAARILNVIRGGDRSYLSTFCVQSDSQFGRSGGLAFLMSQRS